MAEENMNQTAGRELDDTVRGDVYLVLDEKTETRIEATLKRALRTRSTKFVVEQGAASPFDQVRSLLLRNGTSSTWFIHNASTRAPRPCRSNCPLGASRESCVLARKSCSAVILRPQLDTPSLQAMFPGDEVLGIKGFVWDCPHHPAGSRISVLDLVWLPKCEQRPYEVQLSGRLFLDDGTPQSYSRPDNALRASLFERLDPISLRTMENLKSWQDYLDWRQHLLMATKVGARYIAARLDPVTKTLIFTVAAESPDAFARNRFWERHEPVYAYPLDNSKDPWNYRERTLAECNELEVRKSFGVELEDFIRCTPRAELAQAFRASGVECPWSHPYFADVAFAAPGKLVERMRSELGNSPEPDDIGEFLAKALKLPRFGFLSLSSVGDEVLITRQRRALERFGECGSNAAPFLTNYLFDITKARVPEKVEMPATFHTQELNDGQKQAVATILAAPDVALVQGPPGTGKTTVIAEALWQLVHQGKRVLVVSQSGAAVDNALDRLANVPEIQAIRLMKSRKGAEAPNELSRYAEANVLDNFYKTLGGTARTRLAVWDEQEKLCHGLEAWRPRLLAIEDRLLEENERIRQIESERQNLQSTGEAQLLPALRAFEALGVPVFEPVFNPEWPAEQRRTAIANAVRRVRSCAEMMLPLIKSDIARLQGLSGEDVVSDEDALAMAELKRQIAELDARMDAEADDLVYDQLKDEQRNLRRQVRELVAHSAFDATAYENHFPRADANGRILAETLASVRSRRSDLLAVLQDLATRLERVNGELLRTGYAAYEGRLREIDERMSATFARREEFSRQGSDLLAAMRAEQGRAPEGLLGARDWFADEQARAAVGSDDAKNDRAVLESLYRGWLEHLAQPTTSDTERVLPEYIANCAIVGVTCTSDTRMLEDHGFSHFDVVIIDEVSKATPPELLMSMMLAEKAVLVGDHRQLPPLFGDREPLAMEEIVARDEEDEVPEAQRISRAKFRQYERMVGTSLFKEYFEQAPDAIKCMLWEQHRMHPDIMRLVNSFYDNRLVCGLRNADSQRDHQLGTSIPWMRAPGHAYWIDSSLDPDGCPFEEEQSGSSKVNRLEVALMMKALRDLDAALEARSRETGAEMKKTVGVIAFYGHQKTLLRRAMQSAEFKHLDWRVDTVDRFQGQERDYVLVSMTRNRVHHDRSGRVSNAYVAKFERINVAFSRARELLLIFGARDMFVDYMVTLPPLFTAGKATAEPVYRRMVRDLECHGRLNRASDVLTSAEWHAAQQGDRKNLPGGRKNVDRRPYRNRR